MKPSASETTLQSGAGHGSVTNANTTAWAAETRRAARRQQTSAVGRDKHRANISALGLGLLTAVIVAASIQRGQASARGERPMIWQEGELWYAQNASGGDVLREGASGLYTTHPALARPVSGQEAFVLYRFSLPEAISHGQVLFRYANGAKRAAEMRVSIDGGSNASISFPGTGGCGRKVGDYRYVSLPAGELASGPHELKLVCADLAADVPVGEDDGAEADGLVIDGFFLAPEGMAGPRSPMEFFSWTARTRHADLAGERRRNGPVVAWTRSAWSAIENAAVLLPDQDDLARPFEFKACVNEYLSMPVFLTAADQPATVEVSLANGGELAGRTQTRICGLFQARTYGLVFDPLFSGEELKQLDDLSPYVVNWDQITGFPRLKFHPYQTHLVWLTLNTEEMKPGRYSLDVQIKTAAASSSVRLQVRILPIVLPRENPLLFYVFNWTGNEPQRIDDMLAHGINTFRTSPYEQGGKAVPPGHRYALEHGARFFLYYYRAAWGLKPVTEERRRMAREDIEQILTSVRSLGLNRDQWAIQISDEPNARNADVLVEYARMIRQIDPQAPIWIDPGWGPLRRDYPLERFFLKLMPFVDVWCPFVGHLSRTDIDVGALVRRAGKKLWFYRNIALEAKKPNACFDWFRIAPWAAWYYKTDGAGVWNLAQFYGDPWDNFDRKIPDAAFVYKGWDERFIPGRVYEALRQGVQEYKRFYLLEELVNQLWERGDKEEAAETYEMMRDAARQIVEMPSPGLIAAQVDRIEQAIIRTQRSCREP